MKMANSEVNKVKHHLDLLRAEHVNLQHKHAQLQREYDILAASQEGVISNDCDSFVQRLVSTVAELYEKDLFSDITIHVDGHQLRAHRFVLACRSKHWGVDDLSATDHLQFPADMPYNISTSLLQWVYTDKLDTHMTDEFVMDLMKAAIQFKLDSLKQRCEQLLISRLEISNCVSFYQTADKIGAIKLRDACSHLISQRWEDFNSEDFKEMSAQLLYKMLRSKAEFPLHTAIRLKREDVLFLYLIEFDSDLEARLNECDGNGALPLALALQSEQLSMAKTLVSHKASVDALDNNKTPLLCLAVQSNHEQFCQFLLENGVNVDCKGVNGSTPLHMLCNTLDSTGECAMWHVLDSIIAKSININDLDEEGNSCLHICVTRGNAELLRRLLISKNIDIHVKDSLGRGPLLVALSTQPPVLHLAKMLINRGANLDSVDQSGESLLLQLIGEDTEESALFLIEAGANVTLWNRNEVTPLHRACSLGLESIVKELLKRGVNPSAQTTDEGDTSVHVAVKHNQVGCLKAIIECQDPVANLNIKNNNGETPLAVALKMQNLPIATDLVKGGSDMNVMDKDGLNLILNCITSGYEDGALFLIRHGADASKRSPEGDTPLQLAVASQLAVLVRSLCRAGADMNVKDKNGLPPLWTSLELGCEDVSSSLVEHGCDVNGWADGLGGCTQTMLMRAIDDSNEGAACFLIRSQCDVNSTRKPGPGGEEPEEAKDKQTPLHLATTWGLEQVVDCLIEHNADVNAQDCEGQTPVHVAVMNQNEAILRLLMRSPEITLSIKDRRGQTPFALAMQVKNIKAAQVILKKEPRVANQVDGKGHNLLHTAVRNCDLEAVLFMLSVHADVNTKVQDASQVSPLHLAAETGNEMIVRNLLLAGAEVGCEASRGRTPLHFAVQSDKANVVIILLENAADPCAVDDHQYNALHMACYKSSVSCVKALLNNCNVNLFGQTVRGQTPLHVLGQYGKDSAAAILECLMQNDPSLPVDALDNDGNTALLLAYMNANPQLCRALVQTGCCIATVNYQSISIFNFETPTKQLLRHLLEDLAKEPKWADGDNCSHCLLKFSLTSRKHHCRHCGRLLCSKCSDKSMPIIKYNLQKPVRVCELCSSILTGYED